MVKRVIPNDRLLHMRLEDGLDWPKLCQFLDKPIPEVSFPQANSTKDYLAVVTDGIVAAWIREAQIRAAAIVVAAISIGFGIFFIPK